MAVALPLRFLVHHDGLSGGRRILRVVEDGHLKSARHALILLQLNFELVGVFCLDALCNDRSMLIVASPSAELDKYEMACILTAAVQNLHLL